MPQITTPETNITPKDALDLLRAELDAMQEPDIMRRPGLDAAMAVTIAMGSLARISQCRDEVLAECGAAGAQAIDMLPIACQAVVQTGVDLATADSISDLSAKFEPISANHQLLLADAMSLVQRKLLPADQVEQGRPCQGYRATLSSILVLVAIFRSRFTAIERYTPLTLDDLRRIESEAVAMSRMLDEREVGANRLHASEMRTRALTKLIRTYGEVRRMITYVRWWSDDADDIAPSLWSGRRGKGRSGTADPSGNEPSIDPIPLPIGPNAGSPFTS